MNSKFVSKRNVNLKYFLRIFFLAFSIFSFHSVEAQTVSRTSLFNAFKSYIKPAPIGGTVPAFLPNFTNPISTNSTTPPTQTIITKQISKEEISNIVKSFLKQKEFISQLQGPQGPQGEAGPQGLTGPQGPAGSAGSSTIIRPSGISSGATAFNATNLSSNHLSTGTGNITELTVKDSLTNTGTLSVTGATTLGALTTTTINGNTITTGTGTLTLASGKALTLADAFTTSGANPITLTTTGTTSLTLPTSGTLVSSVTTGNGVSATNTAGALAFTLGAITPTTVNALTLTSAITGFTIAGGTASKTLTVDEDATLSAKANLASPTFTGTVTIPTPFTLGATSVTTTGAQLNYINTATGTTGTNTTNLVYSTSPNITTPTFTTNITTPLVIGGTGVSDKITYKSTTGAGTVTGIAHQFIGGTDGATVGTTMLNNGNVGIGSAAPSSKLEVTGDIRLTSGSGGQIIFADGSTMASSGLGSAAALSATGDAIVTGDSDANATGDVVLKTGSNDRLHILNGGNVGIGSANPGSLLDVAGNLRATTINGNTFTTGTSTYTGTAGQTYTFPTTTSTLLATDGSLSSLTGTISSTVLGNSSVFIGTTSVALNRGTGALTLAGITLTTPDIGVATATSINKLTITTPATGSTLTIDDGFTLHATGNVTALSGSSTGANTGDNATNTQYSGLAASKADVGQTFYIGTTQVAINRASAALTLAGLTLTTPDLGTPTTLVGTNISGTAASLTAGAVTSIATHASTELSDTTNIARLDAANAFTNVGINSFVGNVGVGSASPNAKLDVRDGNLFLTDADVAHGVTSGGYVTSTYGIAEVWDTLKGGLLIRGLSDSADTRGLQLQGMIGDADPTDSEPAIVLQAEKKSGAGQQALGALETALLIENQTTALMTILGNGNVGIGTTNPGTLLTLAKDNTISVATADGSDNGSLGISGAGDSSYTRGGHVLLYGNEGPTNLKGSVLLRAGDVTHTGTYDGYIFFRTGNNLDRMVIDNTGNVGIGTTGPSYPLDVQAALSVLQLKSTTASNQAYFEANDGTNRLLAGINSDAGSALLTSGGLANSGVITTAGTNALQLGTNFAAAMTILSGGNVGIGTTDPRSKFVVSNAGANGIEIETTGGASGAGYILGYNRTTLARTAIDFYTSGVGDPTMSLSSTGNVGIGTTAPTSAFQVHGASNYGTGSFTARIMDNRAMAANVGGTIILSGNDTTAGQVQNFALIAAHKDNATSGNLAAGLGFYTRAAASGGWTEKTDARMYIDSTGNVGIGTTAPNAKLEILSASKTIASNQGILNINSTDSMAIDLGGSLSFGGSYSGTSATAWANISGRKENINDNNVAGYLAFATRPAGGSSTEWMRITSTGNVGIGTTGPGKTLDVYNTDGEPLLVRSTATGASSNSRFRSARTNSSLTNSGGIIFEAPANTSGTAESASIYHYSNTTGADAGKVKGSLVFANNPGTAAFANVVRMVLQEDGDVGLGGTISDASNLAGSSLAIVSGNIGIGTTAPRGKLDVALASGEAIWIGNRAVQSPVFNSDDGFAFNIDSNNDQTVNIFKIKKDGTAFSDGTELFRVQEDGNVGIGTTNPGAPLEVKGTGTGVTIAKFTDVNTTGCTLATGGTIACSSDVRLKKNIENINYGLDTVMNLRPVLYNWNYETDGTIKNLGFIAQEVESLIPKLVTTDTDANGTKSLNTTGIIPVLTKAIQEMNLKVTDLEGQLAWEGENTSDSLWGHLITKFSDALGVVWEQGVLRIASVISDKLTTKELCVTKSNGVDVCVTGEQLDALLTGSGSSSGGGGGSSTPEPDTTTTPEDGQAPIIFLTGDSVVNLNVGDTYTELGATATDDTDGDITANIITAGTVDTAVVGVYTVTYNVVDTAGNSATEVTRTVNVSEVTPPPEPPPEEPVP